VSLDLHLWGGGISTLLGSSSALGSLHPAVIAARFHGLAMEDSRWVRQQARWRPFQGDIQKLYQSPITGKDETGVAAVQEAAPIKIVFLQSAG